MDAADALLSDPESARLIARAARVAQTAISIYTYDGPESAKVAGCGSCAEACAFVHTLPWGPQACRRGREKQAQVALKRGRPVPYLCHMGFACVAAPIGTDTAGHVATFGPFSPAETPNALEHDAREGLAQLEQSPREELPFTLADIPSVSAEIVSKVAEWLQETLLKQVFSSANDREASAESRLETKTKQSGVSRSAPVRDAYNARAILAALASPDSAALREAVSNQLASGKAVRRPEQLRARVSALVAAVAEAAQAHGRSGGAVPAVDRLGEVDTPTAAVATVVRALMPLRKQALKADDASSRFYAQFEAYVEQRLADNLSLEAAATHFNALPSTLTRRLERRYGLTFTGYVARRRVERAKTLLAQNKLSVDAVAKRVGLTDGAHLRKLLNRFEGVTPSDLRAKRAAGRD